MGSRKLLLATFSAIFLIVGGLGAWAFKSLRRPNAVPSLRVEKAMRLAFHDYNPAHGGVLSPAKQTRAWDLKGAQELLTPMLLADYMESGRRKAVLVVQSQGLEGGEVLESHAQGAGLSFYLFAEEQGEWRLERRSRKPLEAGSYGAAPEGRLVRLGPERFGILFETGYTAQGTTTGGVFLVPVSEGDFQASPTFDIGEDNGGECTDDPVEQQKDGLPPCWSWSAELTFHPVEGDDHYALRLARKGTGPDESGKAVVPYDRITYYLFRGGTYRETGLDPTRLGPPVVQPTRRSPRRVAAMEAPQS